MVEQSAIALEDLYSRVPASERTTWAKEHGLGGFLFKWLGQQEFQRDYVENRNLNIILLDQYNQISDFYGQHGRALRGIKGIDFIESIYDDLSLRRMTDIDVVTESLDASLLLKLGYRPIKEKKWRANQHKKSLTKTCHGADVTFELHNSLFGQSEECFSAELYFVYLCSHWVHQHNMLKLFWLFDLGIFLRKNKLCEKKLKKIAKKYQRSVSLDYAFSALELLGFSSAIKFTKRSLVNKNFLCHPRKNNLKYYWIKHLTKDQMTQAFGYDLQWLLSKIS